MSSPQTPNLPTGWVVVVDRQQVIDQIGQNLDKYSQIGGIEIRLDLWQGAPPDTGQIKRLSVLFTDRNGAHAQKGGHDRDDLCREQHGILDVDPETDRPAPADLQWIFSNHRSESAASTPQQQVDQARKMGASAAKIVLPEANPTAARNALKLAEANPDFPVICFCAGEAGISNRIDALENGQLWGYVKLGKYPDQIPGLPTLESISCQLEQ